MSKETVRLSVLAFGLAFGTLWGLSIFFTGVVAWMSDWGDPFVEIIGSMYLGYDGTLLGSFIGGVWGFIDGFVGGVIFAFLYNMFAKCCCRKQCSGSAE